MTSSSTPWESFGAHAYCFEPPDIVHIRNSGEISLEDMQHMFGLVQAAAGRVGGRVFWLADITRMGHVRNEARKFAIDSNIRSVLQGTAIVGGSFQQRAVANLAIKAVRLLNPSRSGTPFKFVATEAEARVFIDGIRKNTQNA